MTKFLTLQTLAIKEKKETKFQFFINSEMNVQECQNEPNDFKNVLWIGYDIGYGDVFKAWNDNENDFVIYIGEKGDEF